jgi:hypothetical protein
MPVDARRLIRKMRGGAQAHLIEASDGHFYVVKFLNNPQHRRILVNEWIASMFLNYLGISAPEGVIVRVSEDFLKQNPDAHFQLGTRRGAIEPGWHFGSRFPGDPMRHAVFDFLPDSLLSKIENLHDFRAVLVFDKWMGNADSRQAIFFRARLKEWLPGSAAHPLRQGFVTQMIDHGYVFEGPNWQFGDSPLQGSYFRPSVYQDVRGLDDFQPWLDRVVNFPEEVVDQAVKQIPAAWLEGQEDELPALLGRLLARRKRVADLIEAMREARKNPFPAWTNRAASF